MGLKIVPKKKTLDKDSETYKMLKRKYGDSIEDLLDKPEKKEDKHKGLKPGEYQTKPDPEAPTGVRRVKQAVQSGGIVGEGAMSSKTQKEPKKKKIPQYYKGGGKVKKNYAYGGRVAKYKG